MIEQTSTNAIAQHAVTVNVVSMAGMDLLVIVIKVILGHIARKVRILCNPNLVVFI